jgi:hypothetical protein
MPRGVDRAPIDLVSSDVTRSAKEGLGFGLIAGVVFAIAQVIATVVAGEPPFLAFRRIASVFVGPLALDTIPAPTVLLVAVIAHLFLSAIYGLFYGIYNSALTMPTRRSVQRQAVIGVLFGVMLWLVNFQVFARYLSPWLLELPQAAQVLLHALCFGLPLGLMYGTAEQISARGDRTAQRPQRGTAS